MKPNKDFWETAIMVLIIIVLGAIFVLLLTEEKECNDNGGVYLRKWYGFECFTLREAQRAREARKEQERK